MQKVVQRLSCDYPCKVIPRRTSGIFKFSNSQLFTFQQLFGYSSTYSHHNHAEASLYNSVPVHRVCIDRTTNTRSGTAETRIKSKHKRRYGTGAEAAAPFQYIYRYRRKGTHRP